jgi:hypothetical protein
MIVAGCAMRLSVSLLWSCLLLLVLLGVSLSLGCGSVYVAGAINPSGTVVTTGSVSFVALSVQSGPNGTLFNITAVTLAAPFGSSSLAFCGDQRASFPMNAVVRVSYTEGTGCSNLVTITPV